MKHLNLLAIAAVFPSLSLTVRAQDMRTLCDFEQSKDLSAWEISSGAPKLVSEGVTSGHQALELTFDAAGAYHPAYLCSYRLPRDWSKYDALVLDVLNPNREPVTGYLLVGDEAWRAKGSTYWNRHNSERALPPGATRWVIPVRGLYRGEAGSRNNDIKQDIDPASIVRVDFGFGRKGSQGRIVVDNLHLVKAAAPAGVWAFDFGPTSQPVMLGWTPVSHETRFTPERGYGWGPQGGSPWEGACRDTTFGTALLSDFCEAGGYRFRVAAPAGRYQITVYFENSGYWGGEQASFRWRRIAVNGRPAWEDVRPDGPAHALYRFEEVEPLAGDIWDAYMAPELAKPAVFEAEADSANGLTLHFEADRVWGSKVAALAIVKAGDDQAAGWLAGPQRALAAEFRSLAANLDSPAPAFAWPTSWREAGLAAWPLRIEDDIAPQSFPPAAALPARPSELALSRQAVRGETETFCLALRPFRDFGECGLSVEPLAGAGKIEATAQVVWYNTRRGFGEIAYRVRGHTLRNQNRVKLPAGVTRELVIRVKIPENAPAGDYRGALVLSDAASKELLRVPLRLSVVPVTLCRETDFLMGYYGLMPPELLPEDRRGPVLEETLRLLREYGMNAVCGGPDWRLTGWKDGKPLIDFGEMDRFYALLAKHGFNRPLNGYGGARFEGLHEGYVKGHVGSEVEKQSGLPYGEALLRAWAAVHEHARAAGWPNIFYAMCDETRVRDVAESELDFMRLMAAVSRRYPATVRTSGSYSVDFNERPSDPSNMTYWHQRFFPTLDISSLNDHDETVLSEAKALSKEVHIYNQGTSRYSFGLYQWNECQKGVKARWQWHLNILHGYQFFDLDGREPDTAMLCYGRNAIYPTLDFERCREGAEDFYLCQMLARRTPDSAFLRQATTGLRLNQREPPTGFDADAFKAGLIQALLATGSDAH